MFQCVGMDALMYTRFFRWGLETFVFSFAVGISIVLPTNYFGSTGEESTATGLDRLSLSNVDSSASLWAHWVCAYLIFPFAMWRLHRLYKLVSGGHCCSGGSGSRPCHCASFEPMGACNSGVDAGHCYLAYNRT